MHHRLAFIARIAFVLVSSLSVFGSLWACSPVAPKDLAGPRLHLHADVPQNVVVTSDAPWSIIGATSSLTVSRIDDVLMVTPHGDGALLLGVENATISLDIDTATFTQGANDPLQVCGDSLCVARGESLAGVPMLAFTSPRPTVDVTAPARARQRATDADYPLVFPFFALELLGETLETDTADLNPNLDTVNALAYERHHIQNGQFVVRSPITSDPKAYADEHGLPAWPMLTHDRPITPEDISSLFNARSTIISDAVATAVARGYEGYVLDVEVSFNDIATPRAQYLAFVEELVAALHAVDVKLMVATARWINLAPIDALAATDVDYIASMDPMHPGGLNMWLQKIPTTYADVGDPSRLVWVFSWDFFRDAAGRQEQLDQLQWMEDNGYNVGIAGASCFRTPMATPNAFHSIDYYAAFRAHYPAADSTNVATGTVRGVVWDTDITALAPDAAAAGALLPAAVVDCGTCDVTIAVDPETAAWRANLPPGNYTLTATSPGHEPTSREVTVAAGATVWASLGLSAIGAEPEANEPDGATPEPAPDGGEPDVNEPDGNEPAAPNPDAPNPEGDPEAIEPDANEPAGPGPNTLAPEDEPLPPSVQPQCACAAPRAALPLSALGLVGLVAVSLGRPRRHRKLARDRARA